MEHSQHIYYESDTAAWGWSCGCSPTAHEFGYGNREQAERGAFLHHEESRDHTGNLVDYEPDSPDPRLTGPQERPKP